MADGRRVDGAGGVGRPAPGWSNRWTGGRPTRCRRGHPRPPRVRHRPGWRPTGELWAMGFPPSGRVCCQISETGRAAWATRGRGRCRAGGEGNAENQEGARSRRRRPTARGARVTTGRRPARFGGVRSLSSIRSRNPPPMSWPTCIPSLPIVLSWFCPVPHPLGPGVRRPAPATEDGQRRSPGMRVVRAPSGIGSLDRRTEPDLPHRPRRRLPVVPGRSRPARSTAGHGPGPIRRRRRRRGPRRTPPGPGAGRTSPPARRPPRPGPPGGGRRR